MLGNIRGLRAGTTGAEVDPTILGALGDGVQDKRILWAGIQGRQEGDPRGATLADSL